MYVSVFDLQTVFGSGTPEASWCRRTLVSSVRIKEWNGKDCCSTIVTIPVST